jgi:hypothetical protein
VIKIGDIHDNEVPNLLIDKLGKHKLREIVHSYLKYRFDSKKILTDEDLKIVQRFLVEKLQDGEVFP